MAGDGCNEYLRRGLERAQLKQVVAPVEEVLLGRIEACGALISLGGYDKIPRPFFDVAEQILELPGLLPLEHPLDLAARIVGALGFEIGQGQVVAVGAVRRIDVARALEGRNGEGQLAALDVELAERAMRLKALRIAPGGVCELPFDRRGVRRRARTRRRLGRGGLPARCSAARGAEQHERGDEPAPPPRGSRAVGERCVARSVVNQGSGVRSPDLAASRNAGARRGVPLLAKLTNRTSSRAGFGVACCACW